MIDTRVHVGMDPSQIQEDKANDIHSLENTDGTDTAGAPAADATATDNQKNADGSVTITDASNGASAAPPPPPKKQSFIKRLWHKFNIYLVLFVLIVVLAVGIVVAMTVQSRKTQQNKINSQGLSQSALQQLANTDVTVGDAKQVLTVQSNAIFAGSVLVRSGLEVAGTLKVGGKLTLTDLTVSGATQLSDAQVNNLTVNGALNMQGALTIKNGINVSGNSAFAGNLTASQVTTGSLQLNGDLKLTHHITAGGTTPNASRGTAVGGGGTISLNGSDTAGSVTVNTGSSPPAGCFATVTFSEKFSSTPRVVITPVGSAAAELNYYVERSTSSFSICTTNSAPSGQTFAFDYIILN
jgi:cytoskeletal protein CcmA (bactofilin family)